LRPAAGRHDDLGARLLAEHPRGEEWRHLDVTVANLTLDQLWRMAELTGPDHSRATARAQLIENLGDGELAGRLGSRWVRWAATYGPHTQHTLALLRRARTLPLTTVTRIRRARAMLDPAEWTTARHAVEDSAPNWGYPFRPQCLFWEAVPAAEDAARQSPTDPYLADAL
jgi:hypothetical protein